MKMNKTLTALVTGASLGLAGQAFAAGTIAGSTVSNTATLGYSVSGVNQNNVLSQAEFNVDYKVDMNITATADTGNAAPGETVTLTYALTNTGNSGATGVAAAQSYVVSVSNNGNADHTPISVAFYSDAGLTTPLTNNKVSALPDATVTFYAEVELTKNANVKNGDDVEMIVSARALDASDTDGTSFLVQNPTADKNSNLSTSYVVFAESATGSDVKENGIITDNFVRTIQTAEFTDPNDSNASPKLTAAIVNDIICDNSLTSASTADYSGGSCPNASAASYLPKAIPTSMAKYTYTAKNTGSVTANSVTFNEPLPAGHQTGSLNTLTLKVGPSGALVDLTSSLTVVANAPDAANEYRFNGDTVELFIGDIAAGNEVEVTFTAIVE